ncbi:MAG: polysaccharide biosynthesis protein [Candidatus Pacebacteria bacterium]|nr:polysaccharide biosynthesis protein [Candidatus Paceibacterota bacterium]
MDAKDSRVLVTGAHGFLGKHIVDVLRREGIPFVRYSRDGSEKLPEAIEIVIHAGGLTPVSPGALNADAATFLRANRDGTEKLLTEISSLPNLKKIINIGSAAEYGCHEEVITEETLPRPVSTYGISKLAQTELVEAFSREHPDISVVNLRLFNIVGMGGNVSPEQEKETRNSIFTELKTQFMKPGVQTIRVSHPDTLRDYLAPEDVAEAVLLAAQERLPAGYTNINICSGVGTPLSEVVQIFSSIYNQPYVLEGIQDVPEHSVGNPERARLLLSWNPRVSLKTSVERVASATRILVVGAGVGAQELLTRMRAEERSDLVVVGLVDDDSAKQGGSVLGYPVVGTINDIPTLLGAYRVNQVLISTPSVGRELVQRVTEVVPPGFPVKILPSISSVLLGTVTLAQVRDVDPSDLIGRPLVKLDQRRIAAAVSGNVFLVTGGAGSIGSEIVRQLRAGGAREIHVLDSWEEGIFNLLEECEHLEASETPVYAHIGNVRDQERIEEILSAHEIQVIIHAAAYKHVPLMEEHPGEARKTNYEGTRNMLEAAVRHHVKDFVLISTDKAVRPSSVMGATKRDAELLVKEYARKYPAHRFCAVRFGNVLNSSGSVLPKFMRQIKNRGPVTITHRDMTRYFMTIPEAVSLVLLSWLVAENGQILLLDMGEPVRIFTLAHTLIKLYGYEPYTDIDIIEVGTRPGEKIHEELSYDPHHLRPSPADRVFIAEDLNDA